MTEKPTAQECEELKKEVKDLKWLIWDWIMFYIYPIFLILLINFSYLSRDIKLCALLAVALVVWATEKITDTIKSK